MPFTLDGQPFADSTVAFVLLQRGLMEKDEMSNLGFHEGDSDHTSTASPAASSKNASATSSQSSGQDRLV